MAQEKATPAAAPEAKDFDPSRLASARLLNHILQKGFQSGGVLGVGAIAPAVALYNKSLDPRLLTKTLGYSALGFTALAGAAGVAKLTQIDQDGVEDRVYRLHYNEGQNRTDTFAAIGGILGAAAANWLLKSRGLPVEAINIVGGSAAGSALGVLLHLLTRPADQKTANKMVHELKTN